MHAEPLHRKESFVAAAGFVVVALMAGITGGSLSPATADVAPLVASTAPVGQWFHAVTPVRIIDSRPAPSRVGPLATWGEQQTQDVTVVGGSSGVPDTATAVVLNVTGLNATKANDYVSIWPSGATQPTVSSLNLDPGQTKANQVTVKVGSGSGHAGKVSIFNADGTADVVVDVNGYYDPTAGDGFTSVSPSRILDSRTGPQHVGSATTWTAGQTQQVAVASLGGVPADADAVVLNVTATNGTADGNYLSIWPAGAPQATVSSLNVDAGRSVPNAVTVKLGSGGSNQGQLSIFSADGTQDVIIDVAGYFKAGSGKAFYPLVPTRLIDSRDVDHIGPLWNWTDDLIQLLPVAGQVGVPVGADSVVTNVTATSGQINGDYLTIYPAGSGMPVVSSLNIDAYEPAVANAVTARLGAVDPYRGQIAIYNAAGILNVIIDVYGYYA